MTPVKLHENEMIRSECNRKTMQHLVSVVIPTYNRAEFVVRAVRSVLAQTYSSLEVIVVDDASTDDTQKRMETMQGTDKRIKYICHMQNSGSQTARNTGVEAAQGQFIAFLDSDNEWLPRKLEKQMNLFTNKEYSPGAVYCGYAKVSMDDTVLHEYMPIYRGFIYKQTLADWLTDTSTIVVRKSFLEKINGFDINVSAYQEWDLCIRLAHVCEFDFVSESLAVYHEHDLPSISKNYLINGHAYLAIVKKYRNDILAECGRSALSNHYLQAGRFFILAKRMDFARNCFLKSIQNNPLKVKALMNLGVSLLGYNVYQSIRSHRHSAVKHID